MSPIFRLLIRRLGISLIVLIGVSMLIFAIARIIPGDPARIALGPNATVQQIANLRAEMHLDEPLLVQYGYFLADVIQGDLGTSLYTNRPVTLDIAQFLPATIELVLLAGVIMVGLGLPLGIVAAAVSRALARPSGARFCAADSFCAQLRLGRYPNASIRFLFAAFPDCGPHFRYIRD